jgi:hypothetical protein
MHPTHEIRRWDSGPGGEQTIRIAAAYLCPRSQCNRPSLAFFDIGYVRSYFTPRGLVGLVPAGRAVPMADLPPEIERDRLEAWSSFHARNLRAAIIMGRAAIQRAVRTLDATPGTLYAEIDDLVQQGKITKTLSEYAHEVRIAGNDAAHPEDLGEVTQAEAEASLAFVDEFLRAAIAMPARAEAQRQARESRTGS